MNVLLAFAAAVVSLRLAGSLLARRGAAHVTWGCALLAYAAASAALAWGAAAGWSEWAFRAYYLFGGLLTAPLLGAGSLLLVGRRWAVTIAIAYSGLAAGVALATPVRGSFGTSLPGGEHFGTLPHVLAIAANSVGTLAVAGVALATIGRRPLGNALILAGVAVAALGSAFGSGEGRTAAALALGAALLYAGVTRSSSRGLARRDSRVAGPEPSAPL